MNDSPFTMRPMREDDLAFTTALRNAPDTREWFFSTRPLTLEGSLAWWRGRDPESSVDLIAERDGRPVGYLALYDIDRQVGVAECGRWMILPECRGQGLSELMGRAMLEAAKAQGLRQVYAEGYLANERSKHAFRKLGFTITLHPERDRWRAEIDPQGVGFRTRAATSQDVATLVEFQCRMAMETEGMTLDPDTVTRGVTAVLTDGNKGEYLLAERSGAVLGGLLLLPEWSDWRNGTVLWIHSVYVRPEARRLGVFRLLYATVKGRVRTEPRLRGLRLYVDQRNERAASVYRCLGMTDEHYALFEWMK